MATEPNHLCHSQPPLYLYVHYTHATVEGGAWNRGEEREREVEAIISDAPGISFGFASSSFFPVKKKCC